MEYLFSKFSDGSRIYHIIEVIPSSGEFSGMVVDVKYSKPLNYIGTHTSYMSNIISSCDYIIGGKKININGYGLFNMNGEPVRKPDLQLFLEGLVRAGNL